MDYRIHKPQPRCATTDRPFAAGEPFYSALVREEGKIVRIDLASDAWHGPSEATIAWWKSTLPEENAKPTLAPVDVLLDLLEQLEGEPEDAPLRYLLALVLVRRRVLKIADGPDDAADDAPMLAVSCRRRGSDYLIPIAAPDAADRDSLEQRLTGLLWAGEAA